MAGRVRTAAIVQARFGSTRLRGKVLEPLAGRTMLGEVLERCRRIAGIDLVCCAVAEGTESDPVALEAARAGVVVVRGDEADVLGRYQRAARLIDPDVILRVTSDCPYLDPAVAADVVALVCRDGYDYASNNMPPTWPHGLDCEAFRRGWLDRAAEEATDPADREHVTPWLRRQTSLRRANLASPDPTLRQLRWTVDTAEDLALAREVFARLPADDRRYDYQTVWTVIAADPALWRRSRYPGAADRPTWGCAPPMLQAVAQITAGRLAA